MVAKELRIGNLIKFPFNEKPIIVSEAVIKYCFDDNKLYDPIPLTEEWLLKFGFENIDGQKYNPNDEYADQFEYTLESGISHRDFICRPSKGWVIKLGNYDDELEVMYVHEFQNLFFALKGKELTIKN